MFEFDQFRNIFVACLHLADQAPGLLRGLSSRRILKDVDCFDQGMFYNDPVKMEGSERTVELSAEACQQRCQVVEDSWLCFVSGSFALLFLAFAFFQPQGEGIVTCLCYFLWRQLILCYLYLFAEYMQAGDVEICTMQR